MSGRSELGYQVLERGNQWKDRAVGRSSELRGQVALRGSELRDHAVDAAERAREAVSRTSALDRDKATYKSLSLATGIVAGALAGAAFTRVWRVVSDEEAPEPTALNHDIRRVLFAGALQGAVFGLVKAAIGRVTAQSYHRFTGHDLKR